MFYIKIANAQTFILSEIIKLHTTYSLAVKVVLDCKAVHNAGGRPAALNVGQENHQQCKLVVFHSEQRRSKSQLFNQPYSPKDLQKTLDLTCLFCCCLERMKGRIQWWRISLLVLHKAVLSTLSKGPFIPTPQTGLLIIFTSCD